MPVSVTIPSGKLYAFSPSMMTISGLTANDKVVISANGYSFTRFALGSTMNVPLSKILKACFAGVDVNDVEPPNYDNGEIKNLGTKLISASTAINVVVNDGTPIVKNIRALFGCGLKIGEAYTSTSTIYRFGSLPFSITTNEETAVTMQFNNGDFGEVETPFGVDVFPIDEPTFASIKNVYGTILRTYLIEDVELCGELIYLRWIDRNWDYRYFAFEKISSDSNENVGDTFTKELQDLSSTANGLYKNPSKVINKITNDVEIGSVLATYEQQLFIRSLKESVFVCKYLGDNKWLEVNVNVPNIVIDEKWQQNKSIEIEVNLPNSYNPTL